MPYIPVQRDEGRILYQSTMDRAKLLGDTLTGLGETLYKRDEENKAFRAKNSALKQVISANKEQFGLDENTAKLFLSGDPNKSEKENYLNLATFMEGKITAANLAKEQANIKHTNLQGDLLAQQIKQQEGMIQYMKDDEARKAKEAEASKALSGTQPSITNIANGATNAAKFLPEQSVSNVSLSVTPSATPQAPSNRFRRVTDVSVAPSPVSTAETPPMTSNYPAAYTTPAVSGFSSPIVNAAQPIDQYRALRPSDVAFGPTALAASRFAGPVSPLRNIPASVNTAVPIAAPNVSIDPAALQSARQNFDAAISAPSDQFTLPQVKLSPGAKAIAEKLREQFDDWSAISEKRAASPRLTASEDDSKAGSLKKRRTITLDEEGIKAIISNPQILVESFGDVMGAPYEKAMRNQAVDADWARAAKLREFERQFGVSPARSNIRRTK